VEVEPRLLGALFERPLDLATSLVTAARRAQRPGQRVSREDVAPLIEFHFREPHGAGGIVAARGEVEGEGPRVRPFAGGAQALFDSNGLRLAACRAQGVSERPLVIGQRVFIRRALEDDDRLPRVARGQEHAPPQQERGRVIRTRLERGVAGPRGQIGDAGLELPRGQAAACPGARLGVQRRTRPDGALHHLDRAIEIAREPAQMGRPRKRLQIRPQVDRLLAGRDRLIEIALLHERVAEQEVIKRRPAPGDEFARQRLCFRKAMQVREHMPAQQQPLGATR